MKYNDILMPYVRNINFECDTTIYILVYQIVSYLKSFCMYKNILSIGGCFSAPNPNLLNDHSVVNHSVFQECNPCFCWGTDVSYKPEYKTVTFLREG